MTNKLFFLVILGVLAGCVSAPTRYSDGGVDMATIEETALVEKGAMYRALAVESTENSLINTASFKSEAAVIMEELRRRRPEWDWAAIYGNKVKVGMSDNEVLLSWGHPAYKNKASYGDQWVYRTYNFLTRRYYPQYVYIEGGKVVAWN